MLLLRSIRRLRGAALLVGAFTGLTCAGGWVSVRDRRMCVGECAGPLVDAEWITAQIDRVVRVSPRDLDTRDPDTRDFDTRDLLDRQVQWTATVARVERGGPFWDVLWPDDSRVLAVRDSARSSGAELVLTLRVFTVMLDQAGCAQPGVVYEITGARLRYRDDLWLSLNRLFGIEWVIEPVGR